MQVCISSPAYILPVAAGGGIVYEGKDDPENASTTDPYDQTVTIPANTSTIVLFITGASIDGQVVGIKLDPAGVNQSFSQVGSISNAFTRSSEMWYLDAPGVTGAARTIRWDFTGGALGSVLVSALFLSGTDTAGSLRALGSEAEGTGTSEELICTLTGGVSTDMVVHMVCSNTTPTFNWSPTLQITDESTFASFRHNVAIKIGVFASVSSTQDYGACIAAMFKKA